MSLPISFSLNGQDYSLSAQTIDLIPPHFVLGFGAEFSDRDVLVHQSPFALMAQCIGLTFHSFQSLLSPSSDVHIHNLTGPAGILDSLHSFAKYDFRRLLWLLVLLNINLGILNLLPIPFLDGGLIALSCLEKLLGRDIPSRLINTAYACFFLFFVGLVLYLSFFDFNRILMRNDGRRDFLRWQRLRIPEQSFWNAHPCSSP
jgi:regulator of sigma E protease